MIFIIKKGKEEVYVVTCVLISDDRPLDGDTKPTPERERQDRLDRHNAQTCVCVSEVTESKTLT